MSKISAQPSVDQVVEVISEVDNELQRTPSESTFTRHTKSVHAIIKEVILGLIMILQLYLTLKISK